MVQDRAISTKCLTKAYMHSHLPLFVKNRFPTSFGGHLEILNKTQKAFIVEMV